MPFYTPLRYPGGKRRLAPIVMRLLETNRLKNVDYAEPYAGGAAIALALLFEEYASTVHINDLSRPVYAFWHTVLNDTAELCRKVGCVKVTIREWRRQRAVYEERNTSDLSDLGFAALFLNRTNRSGIIDGGVIGGQHQTGQWGLDARFNKTELIQRIKRVARYKNRIALYRSDAINFTDEVLPRLGANAFVFYDPPYLENGRDLYLNTYQIADHRRMAERIRKLEQPWIVTYDYAAIRANLYPSHSRIIYGLPYSAQSRYRGREVIFICHSLKVPKSWLNSRIPMARPKSPYPLYGRMKLVKPHAERKNRTESDET
ncbi:MAG: DNA methyltransferase [Acidobacteria bacterium]|nr:MAG: DNA methyltransferase [Acidobacteriota bacterium]